MIGYKWAVISIEPVYARLILPNGSETGSVRWNSYGSLPAHAFHLRRVAWMPKLEVNHSFHMKTSPFRWSINLPLSPATKLDRHHNMLSACLLITFHTWRNMHDSLDKEVSVLWWSAQVLFGSIYHQLKNVFHTTTSPKVNLTLSMNLIVIDFHDLWFCANSKHLCW